MAVIWQKVVGKTRYQVRTAGKSVRLYTNSVFHSQWNPNRMLTGSVWDLLLLPTLMGPKQTNFKRALVLGVGGGAVMRHLAQCYSLKNLVGVDLDPTHLYIAQRYFGINQNCLANGRVSLVHANAEDWVKRNRAKFDVIIEDLFKEGNHGEPVRAIYASPEWLERLFSSLSRDSMLIMNFESHAQWLHTKRVVKMRDYGISHSAVLKLPHYENRIGVFSRQNLDISELHRNVLAYCGMTKEKFTKCDYEIKRYKMS